MQLSPVPLIRPHAPQQAASNPSTLIASRSLAATARPVPSPAPQQPPWAPAPNLPKLASSQATCGRKPRGGESNDGRIWIANQTPLNQVLLARLDLSNPELPALLLQLPNERRPVRFTVSPATGHRCAGGHAGGAEALVALHPVGCSSTRRSWYFRAEPAGDNVVAWPQTVPAAPTPAKARPAAAAPPASVSAIGAHASAEAAMPFVVLHGGHGAREALYLARRFDAQCEDAGFVIHLADLPANVQMAGPTAAQLTTVHLDKALKTVHVQRQDTTVLLQGAVSHAQLAAFYDEDMEGPFIDLPYAASMALVRLLGSQLGGHSVAQWHASLVRVARAAAQGEAREVACA